MPPRPSELVERLRDSKVLFGTAIGLLGLHLVGMLLGGFSQGFVVVALMATFIGFVAVPVCVWAAARVIDWLLDWVLDHLMKTRVGLGGFLRLALAFVLILGSPELFRLAKLLPLPNIGRVVELSAVFLSIAMATGLVLLGLAVADLIYALTARFRSLSNRLMLMVMVSTIGTVLWFAYLAKQAQSLVAWAIEQGHLGDFASILTTLQAAGVGVFGGAASVVGVLELPFVLLLAWRFGQNASHGIERLRQAFARVAQGDLSTGLEVVGNDEIAEMQRGFN
jgi:hypothetical protein